MPVCPSGSEPKTGSPASAHFDPSVFASFLPAGLQWLVPFLPYLPSIDIDFAAFCALEPPSTSVITTDDIIDLLNPSAISLAYIAGQKIAAWVHLYLWYQYCQCKTPDPAPTVPTAPTAPTPLPVVNPIGPNPTSPGCDSYTSTALAVPNSQFVNHVNREVPSTAQTYRGRFVDAVAGASHNGVQWSVVWYNPQFTSIKTETPVNMASGATTSFSYSVPTGAKYFSASVTAGAPGSSDLQHIELTVDCGPSGTTAPPVVQPAPDIRIGQILELVTLIQRQAVPFALVGSTSHTGLTGQGELSVQGLIGVLVTLTTVPSSYGLVDGHPDIRFDVGWITWGDSLGWRPTETLRASPHLSMPYAIGGATKLGYSFAPGVVATIRELVREP